MLFNPSAFAFSKNKALMWITHENNYTEKQIPPCLMMSSLKFIDRLTKSTLMLTADCSHLQMAENKTINNSELKHTRTECLTTGGSSH